MGCELLRCFNLLCFLKKSTNRSIHKKSYLEYTFGYSQVRTYFLVYFSSPACVCAFLWMHFCLWSLLLQLWICGSISIFSIPNQNRRINKNIFRRFHHHRRQKQASRIKEAKRKKKVEEEDAAAADGCNAPIFQPPHPSLFPHQHPRPTPACNFACLAFSIMKIAKLFINPEQLQFGLMARGLQRGACNIEPTMRSVNWVNASITIRNPLGELGKTFKIRQAK